MSKSGRRAGDVSPLFSSLNRGLTPPARLAENSLDLDLGAGLFELLLDGLGVFLGRLLLDRLGSALDEGLAFGQTAAGDLAHDLDDGDLLRRVGQAGQD